MGKQPPLHWCVAVSENDALRAENERLRAELQHSRESTGKLLNQAAKQIRELETALEQLANYPNSEPRIIEQIAREALGLNSRRADHGQAAAAASSTAADP